jgi:hypothetical protein
MGMMAPPEMAGIARRAVRAAGQNLRPESIITDISVKETLFTRACACQGRISTFIQNSRNLRIDKATD